MKYEITVGEVQAQNSSVKGYASVVFGDSFKVSNIAILADRNNRLYISMPHYKNQDHKKFSWGAGGKYFAFTGEPAADGAEEIPCGGWAGHGAAFYGGGHAF